MWTKATISRRSFSSGGKSAALDLVEQIEQAIERVLVTREENLFLVAEVVIEVALLHVQRGGDLLDRRAVIAERRNAAAALLRMSMRVVRDRAAFPSPSAAARWRRRFDAAAGRAGRVDSPLTRL